MKIIHLISHPIPYNAPLYRLIAKRRDIDFEVWYDRDTHGGYFDPGFDRVIDWGVDLRSGYRSRLIAWPTLELRRKPADVLWVHGYASFRHLAAIVAAKQAGMKVWVRGESHHLLPASRWQRAIRQRMLPWFFRQVDCCLYIGTLNREFYESYGVPKKKLVFMPYCVDNDWWRDYPPVQRGDFELFVGKLLPEKGVSTLVRYADKNPDRRIFVAGDGPLRIDRPNITYKGFQRPDQLRSLYHQCRYLLMLSHYEPWGLVVNEALCCGCCVVGSLPSIAAIHDISTPADMRTWSYVQDLQGLTEALERL